MRSALAGLVKSATGSLFIIQFQPGREKINGLSNPVHTITNAVTGGAGASRSRMLVNAAQSAVQ
jgi:hypothetical protein